MADPFSLHVDFPNAGEVTFNRARVRRAFIRIGQNVLRDARRLVARRAISHAGEAPGYRTGALAKSLGYYVPKASGKRSGFMARIAPNQKNGKGSRHITGDFYPAYLYYGVRRGAKRGKKHKGGSSGGNGWKLAPRKNFMAQALADQRYQTQRLLYTELKRSVRLKKK